jgi:hypothetical protein
MQSRRPSPALVVSIIALVVACAGTAVAATLITSSSQIKNGTIRGVDLKKGTITKTQLSSSVLAGVTSGSSGAGSTQALESHRQTGPDLPKGGSSLVAELALAPGTYAVFAKTTVTPFLTDNGLLDTLFRDNKTLAAECTLDVNGTGDFAIAPVASPGTTNPATLNTQLTRTLDVPGKATLTCKVDTIHWNAENTSILAMKVDSTSRTETP